MAAYHTSQFLQLIYVIVSAYREAISSLIISRLLYKNAGNRIKPYPFLQTVQQQDRIPVINIPIGNEKQ